jgi:hypothetical protein
MLEKTRVGDPGPRRSKEKRMTADRLMPRNQSHAFAGRSSAEGGTNQDARRKHGAVKTGTSASSDAHASEPKSSAEHRRATEAGFFGALLRVLAEAFSSSAGPKSCPQKH